MKSPLQAWLDNLCSMLPKVDRAAYFANSSGEASAAYPQADQDVSDLLGAANLARQQAAPVTSGSKDDNGNLLIAYPVSTDQHQGVVVIMLTASERRKEAVMQLLGWGVSWLQMLNEPQQEHISSSALLPEALPEFDIFEPDATFLTLATGLAEAWGLDKVSLGLMKNGNLKLVARSHQTGLDAKVDLNRKIETALDETLQQVEDPAVPINHFALDQLTDALQETFPGEQLHIVTLRNADKPIGALLLQRAKTPFSSAETTTFNSTTQLLAPLLAVYMQAQPSKWQRLKRELDSSISKLLGQGHAGLKATVVGFLALLGVLIFFPGDFEVTADATLEGLEQTTVVVPFDGFLESASVETGDLVTEGQVLATINDRDLQLELNEVSAERNSLSREYRQALSELDQGQARILRARLDQAEARQALVQHRLSQVNLVSPISGVVIKGDLSRSMGAPVSRGSVLFEVAPLKGYLVALSVREADIDNVSAGLTGHLVLNSHPEIRIPLIVERISAVLEDQQTQGILFRAEAKLQVDQEFFRPGMEGTARISVGKRPLGWILFHDIIDWFRLMAWRHLP